MGLSSVDMSLCSLASEARLRVKNSIQVIDRSQNMITRMPSQMYRVLETDSNMQAQTNAHRVCLCVNANVDDANAENIDR